jgi:hypothetical protein
MTDQELRAWALDRFGSETVADDLELARLLHEDAEFVDRRGDVARDDKDEIPYDRFMADLDGLLGRASSIHSSVHTEGRKGL